MTAVVLQGVCRRPVFLWAGHPPVGAGKLGRNSEWSKNFCRIHRPIAWT